MHSTPLVHSLLHWCANLHAAALSRRCEHLLLAKNTTMSSTAAAAEVSLKEARRATPESDLLLVEVTEWGATEATLRSVTEFHPTGSSRMSIPYRAGCAHSFADGRCILRSIVYNLLKFIICLNFKQEWHFMTH